MTEKAQEKKDNVATNLQIFDGHLIPNENKICALQVKRSLRTKFVKLQCRSTTEETVLQQIIE